MVRTHAYAWALAFGMGFVTLAGCGDGGPKLAPVTGIVNYKGAAVEGASVTFTYEDGNTANGVTGADGKFTLTTGTKSGAPLGKAKISIAKVSGTTYEGSGTPSPDDMMKMFKGGDGNAMKRDATPKNALPGKYSVPDTSGLSEEVKSSGNDFKFDLVD